VLVAASIGAAEPTGVQAQLAALAPRLLSPDFVAQVYASRGYAPLWDDRRAATLVSLLAGSESHGLDPEDYLAEELAGRLPLAKQPPDARASTDILLTESFFRLVYHLRFGKVDPRSLDTNWNYARRLDSADPGAELATLVGAADLKAALANWLRHGPLYDNLRAWLRRYRAIAAAGGWEPVPIGPTLHPGDSDARIVALRRRLAAESYAVGALDSENYDPSLAEHVRAYQARNGLDADGVAGAKTLEALNVPVEGRIDQLRINLERLRWVMQDLPPRYIGVNIAGFRVYYLRGDEIVWSTRAVVGKPYRQTPIFRADMTHIVLNPDWTVPPTILRNDTLPAIRRDRGYLDANHMDVVSSTGRPIDPATIDWSRYPGERFPYMIRQRPGSWNSLGSVKFIFPNDHFVFLHDTPAKALFERSERTFSSGCIRIERPFELAELLLREQPPWNPAAIQAQVESAETKTVFLRERMPVLVLYLTALALDGGESMTFYRDVYRRDPALLEALDRPPVFVPPERVAAPAVSPSR
jgi:murein L,D-transpeptidase YcbB/YkuD